MPTCTLPVLATTSQSRTCVKVQVHAYLYLTCTCHNITKQNVCQGPSACLPVPYLYLPQHHKAERVSRSKCMPTCTLPVLATTSQSRTCVKVQVHAYLYLTCT